VGCREYEFRAVVEHPVLTVRGDTKRIKTK
jgi:hypothetical protein